MCPSQSSARMLSYQQGFLLPLALFIIVAMGTLALSISTLTKQSTSASVVEVISVQALLAAESGSQRALQRLLFDAASRQVADAECVAMNYAFTFNGVEGLSHCSAQVQCRCRYDNGTACVPNDMANYNPSANATTFNSTYYVTSSGRCGSGSFAATRDIEIGAVFEAQP